MNRRVALKSLAALSAPLAGISTGCLGENERAAPSAPADVSPAEQVEWASIGLRHVAFESLAEGDVRVTATVEIRNPTEYRVPVNSVTYRVLYDPGDVSGSFVPFARSSISACGVVDFFGENRSYYDYQQEAGPPCPDVSNDIFVVEPHDTTEITATAEPVTAAESAAATRLAESTGNAFVRVDGEAVLWNTNVDVDFETEKVLEPP